MATPSGIGPSLQDIAQARVEADKADAADQATREKTQRVCRKCGAISAGVTSGAALITCAIVLPPTAPAAGVCGGALIPLVAQSGGDSGEKSGGKLFGTD